MATLWLQFYRRLPRFSGVMISTVQPQDAPILRTEIHALLEKRTIEVVLPEDRESGFYNHYFLVAKKDGGLRRILDLRPLNRALSRRSFKMITVNLDENVLNSQIKAPSPLAVPRAFCQCAEEHVCNPVRPFRF